MFKLITKQSKVQPAIISFLKSYERYKGNTFYTEKRFNNVSKLNPETCTVEQFNKALDATHWTENRCDECSEDFDTLIHVGREPDYEARWLCLCTDCLEKALTTLKESNKK